MTEIAQLFESALRQNRSLILRPAAIKALEEVPTSISLRELMEGPAAPALRELTLDDIAKTLGQRVSGTPVREPRRVVVGAPEVSAASREEQLYREILEALADAPLTIGQLAQRLSMDTDEIRGYLTWMKQAGKVVSSGRARATRYAVAR